jgi:hypothetical protein
MEKERVQEVVSEDGGEDDISQYLEDEDMDIIAVKEPFHQQLERELLMQLEDGEYTKKSQQQQ